MRILEIQGNEKLISLLKMKADLNTEWIELDKKKTEIEEKQNKLALKMNRLNDKAQPMYRELIKEIEVGEFEEHEKLYIDEEDGKLKIRILDAVEEYKAAYKAKKEELLKKQNGDSANKQDAPEPTK